MRAEPNHRTDKFRKVHPTIGSSDSGANWGYFEIGKLRVVSSGEADNGWEHVSVSLPDRCPSWEEMCRVKKVFWRDDETVLQFHPAESDYVRIHPFTLHMWRKVGVNHELPERDLV